MNQRADLAAVRSTGSDFVTGVRMLGRGFGMYLRTPRFLLLGMIPAFISFVLLAAAWGVLFYYLGDLAAAATWFADDWSETGRGVMRFGAGAGIVIVGVLLSVITYTALTLLIGDPFYEVISQKVEERLGGTPGEADLPWYRTWHRNAIDSVRLLLLGIAVAVPLFLLGFIPVVGQTVVPVLDVIIGGWLLAVELTGIPFNRRGLRLKDRRLMLRGNRALALGFGVPVFALLLVPFAAVFVVPAAVAGGTLLTRRLMGLNVELSMADRYGAPVSVVDGQAVVTVDSGAASASVPGGAAASGTVAPGGGRVDIPGSQPGPDETIRL